MQPGIWDGFRFHPTETGLWVSRPCKRVPSHMPGRLLEPPVEESWSVGRLYTLVGSYDDRLSDGRSQTVVLSSDRQSVGSLVSSRTFGRSDGRMVGPSDGRAIVRCSEAWLVGWSDSRTV